MTLITLEREEARPIAGWLVPGENCTALEYRIVVRAWHDIGIIERPRSSNRGVRIDYWTKRAGYKPPQYWCGIWAGLVMIDAGGKVPRYFGGCDQWLPYVKSNPRPGAAILYGKPGDATHIGIVVRVEKDGMWTIEGNRGIPGGDGNPHTNNGEGVFHGLVTRKDILGYFHAVEA